MFMLVLAVLLRRQPQSMNSSFPTVPVHWIQTRRNTPMSMMTLAAIRKMPLGIEYSFESRCPWEREGRDSGNSLCSGQFFVMPQPIGLDQHIGRQFQTFRQAADHVQRERARSIQDVGDPAAGADKRF